MDKGGRKRTGDAVVRPIPLGSATMSPTLSRARNYYRWIAEHFTSMLGDRVLDIGGGFGAHLDHLVDGRRFVMSLDLAEECVADMTRRFRGTPFEARVADIADPTVVEELTALGFDTVVSINVLEHIERDDVALRSMCRVLRPRAGRLFLFVPAHPFLYGSPDRLAGHFRRYTRAGLAARVREAGFDVTAVYYFNAFGVLPYLINSWVVRPRSLGGIVDRQLAFFDRALVPILRCVEARVRVPFGQSLILKASAVEALA